MGGSVQPELELAGDQVDRVQHPPLVAGVVAQQVLRLVVLVVVDGRAGVADLAQHGIAGDVGALVDGQVGGAARRHVPVGGQVGQHHVAGLQRRPRLGAQCGVGGGQRADLSSQVAAGLGVLRGRQGRWLPRLRGSRGGADAGGLQVSAPGPARRWRHGLGRRWLE